MSSLFTRQPIATLMKSTSILASTAKYRNVSTFFSPNSLRRSSMKIFIKQWSQRSVASFMNKKFVRMSREVSQGIAGGKPIVALESTIITHGMPYPQNIETALEVEQIIRDNGAIPATIAIMKGIINVGMESDNLDSLAASASKKDGPIKVSRRDLPYVMSRKLDGGTTVAGTMIIAHAMKIPIFVTGGVGGVHRGGQDTMDVSADLVELGKTPICVVSSGVKSILDIGRTLEFLETQGVCVATYGETNDFPAFYTRRSGFKSPCWVNSIRDVALMVKATIDLELQSGLLIAVPVPKEFSMDETLMEDAIKKAIEKAEGMGAKGKELTPSILSAVAEITKGVSLQTNMALIKNNAKIGARLAVELNQLRSSNPADAKVFVDSSSKAKASPVVIGGSNADSTIKILESEIKLNGSTHAAKVKRSWGGVGRNIAECLYRLGTAPILLTAVDQNTIGSVDVFSLFECRSPEITRGFSNASYTAILDHNGECQMGLGDMAIHDLITPQFILENRDVFQETPLIIMDGNVPTATMTCVLNLAKELNKPVFFEPTDLRKASKPFNTKHQKSICFATPNFNELLAIATSLGFKQEIQFDNSTNNVIQLTKYVSKFVDNLFITLGKRGILVARNASSKSSFFSDKNSNGSLQMRLYSVQEMSNVVSVSGAGDCFAGGLIISMLRGLSEENCISAAINSARVALMSEQAVPELFKNVDEIFTKKKIDFIKIE